MAEKFSDFIRAPGTAGPPTREGIQALGFVLETDIDPVLAKTVRVDEAQGFTGGEQLQGRTNVGLGNVDNTSDANKPVSTAQQTALDLKAPLSSPVLTGTPTAPTATPGTNTTQIATTAFVLANPLAGMPQATVKGRAAGAGTGAPGDLTAAQLFTIISGLAAARPNATASAVGEWRPINAAVNTALVLPTGGTWAYFAIVVNASSGALNSPVIAAGVLAGGTTVLAANAALRYDGFAWRGQGE